MLPFVHNQKYKLPADEQNIALCIFTGYVNTSNINDLHNEGEILPVHAHTELLAEQSLAGSYKSHRVDPKTTSSTSVRPMRPTLNDTYRDRVKNNTIIREQKTAEKTKMRSKVSIDTLSLLS